MKFLSESQRVPLTVVSLKAGGKDSDKRTLTIGFSLAVDLETSAAMPQFLKDAWSAMRKSGSQANVIELKGAVESQNVQFFELAENKSAELRITDVSLENLRLEKIGSRIFLYFTIKEDLGKNIWNWCFYSFMRTVYAQFIECQAELPVGEELKTKAAGK